MTTSTESTPELTLSPMQQHAVASIKAWFNDKKQKTYFLAGYAGTGKSTLVEHAISQLGVKMNKVEFACYTGKAALVLTQKSKGKFKVKTIHRLIYKLDEESKGKPTFVLRPRKELEHIKLIVIDEASMVDGQIMKDLKSFDIKILFIGDTGQLPPVSNSGNEEFLEMFNNPNFTLTEIHRQAEGNPIIHLSMLARTKQPIPYGWHGDNNEVLVINKRQWHTLAQKCYASADQIICGRNNTRHSLNEEIRNHLGFTSPLPQEGDKLICTRNDWNKNIRDINLVNGMSGFIDKIEHDVHNAADMRFDSIKIDFRPDFTEDKFEELYMVKDHFTGKPYKLHGLDYSVYNGFDFGYAITCHKSQGSQWKNLVVISEVLNAEMHHRWLYTAITRSSERLVLVI